MNDEYLIRGMADTPAWKAVERLGQEVLTRLEAEALENEDPSKTQALVFNAQGAKKFRDQLFRVIQNAGYQVQAKGE